MSTNNIYAIDQHAAHERVLLESYINRRCFGFIVRQNITIKLTSKLSNNLMQVLFLDLKNFGVVVESLNSSENVALNTFPVSIPLCCTLPQKFLSLISRFIAARVDYVNGRSLDPDSGVLFLDAAVVLLLQTKACRSAIRFGDPIKLEEQSKLLKQLLQCSQPFHCAHGRPSFAPLLKVIHSKNGLCLHQPMP
uniref:MutL_C domain-containing protein n=1 Tax=Mesocestoides corti TaxID=53468 RepID=A0A5K3EXU8_MESCO